MRFKRSKNIIDTLKIGEHYCPESIDGKHDFRKIHHFNCSDSYPYIQNKCVFCLKEKDMELILPVDNTTSNLELNNKHYYAPPNVDLVINGAIISGPLITQDSTQTVEINTSEWK